MVPFRLLNLPLLAFENVLKQCELMDIFELSLSSSKIREKVQTVRPKVFSRGFVYQENDICVCLVDERRKRVFSLSFIGSNDSRSLQPALRYMKIEGSNIGVIAKRNRRIRIKSESFQQHAVALLDYLGQLFCVETSYLKLDVNLSDKYRLVLRHCAFSNCFRLVLSGDETSDGNIASVWRSLRSCRIESADVTCSLSYGFRWWAMIEREIVKPVNLLVTHARWMTYEHLVSLENEHIFMRFNRFNDLLLNCFLHRWLKGNDCKLKTLTVGICEFLDKSCLFRGLQVLEFDEKRRSKVYEYKYFSKNVIRSFEHGSDILRQDGLLCTVAIIRDYFYFVVWHERFPVIESVV